jgi:hypothetical protein
MNISKADIIKVAAVITAAPRWVVALLAAEGLHLPSDWADWWIVASAISALGMAVVEGVAFAYVFQAWRSTKNTQQAAVIAVMALVSAMLFVAMLTPSIAASVRGVTVGKMLVDDGALYLWAAAVALSTIAIIASVGYAERAAQAPSKQDNGVKIAQEQPATLPNAPSPSVSLPAPQKNALQADFERLVSGGIGRDDAIRQLKAHNPAASGVQIAQAAGVSPATVSRVIRF